LSDDLSNLLIGDDVIPFSPQSIKDNETKIITLLENLYNNINNTWVSNDNFFNTPYEEILDIDKNGKIITRSWVNYQTYLLSDTYELSDNTNPENGKKR